MNKGLKWPLILLACGAMVVAGLTREAWLPLISDDFANDAANRAHRPGLAGHDGALDDEEWLERDDANLKARRGDADAIELLHLPGAGDAPEPTVTGAEADGQGVEGEGRESRGTPGGQAGAARTEEEPETDGEEAEEEVPVPIETVEGQQINPNLKGTLWAVKDTRIRGWVQDKYEPETALYVEIHIDDEAAYDVRAEKRRDHKTLGVIWYFDIADAPELADAEKHTVRAFVYRHDQHGKTELRGSPRARNVGSYPRGKLEEASPELGISGYAWDPDTTDTPCTVIVRIDGETISEIEADTSNEELKARRIAPTDTCAFKIDWPSVLDDGMDHTVQVFAVDTEDGTEHELDGSPRVVNARSGLANQAPFGRFDICNKVVLAGWAYDPDAGTGSIDVEIWIDGELFTQIPANSKRDTLRNSKVTPDPYHGFVTTTPTRLLDGRTHTIRAFALNYPAGVKVELDRSPRQYRLEENSLPMGGFWRADDNMLRGWAADPDLGTEACEIEIYIDGELWKRTRADRHEKWMIGTGFAPNAEHGFAIKPPDWVNDGEEHEVQILAINHPEGPPKNLGTRTIGVNSIFPGFWTHDKLLDTRTDEGLYVRNVSPWYDAYHKDVKVGDVLLEYDGIKAGQKEEKDEGGEITQPASMTRDFRIWLNTTKKKGDKVRFKFWRDGETYEVEIKMGQLKGR